MGSNARAALRQAQTPPGAACEVGQFLHAAQVLLHVVREAAPVSLGVLARHAAALLVIFHDTQQIEQRVMC